MAKSGRSLREEEDLERLEAALQIDRNGPLPREFARDGLDFLLRSLSQDEGSDGDEPPSEDLLDGSAEEETSSQDVPSSSPSVAVTAVAAASAPPPPSSYVPPAKRERSEGAEIRTAVNGLLNRLSETNVERIAAGVISLYQQHPRGLVTDSLGKAALHHLSQEPAPPDSFLNALACLLSLLYSAFPVDVFSSLLEGFVGAATESIGRGASLAMATLLGYLVVFRSVGPRLLLSLLQHSLAAPCVPVESRLEFALRIIRAAYTALRPELPPVVAQLVALPADSSRAKFLAEECRSAGRQPNRLHQPLRKVASAFLRRNGLAQREPLAISLSDVQEIPERGRWWVVGGAWAPSADPKASAAQQPQDQVERAAAAQHMNTAGRKAAFACLMRAADYVDAARSLQELGRHESQARDTLNVILHCCTQEPAFNPFYVGVAGALAKGERSYRKALQFTFWDALRQAGGERAAPAEGGPLVQLVSRGKFFGQLLAAEHLAASSLRRVAFADIGPEDCIALFLQCVLSEFFSAAPESAVRQQAAGCATLRDGSDCDLLCSGLGVFLGARLEHKARNPFHKGVAFSSRIRLFRQQMEQQRSSS